MRRRDISNWQLSRFLGGRILKMKTSPPTFVSCADARKRMTRPNLTTSFAAEGIFI
jgi:hypothetical protein